MTTLHRFCTLHRTRSRHRHLSSSPLNYINTQGKHIMSQYISSEHVEYAGGKPLLSTQPAVDQQSSHSSYSSSCAVVAETQPAKNDLSTANASIDAAANGPVSAVPHRPSPTPQHSQGPPVPNGKPTAPYVDRSNPLSPNSQIAAQTVSSRDPKAAAQAASDLRNVVRRKLTGYVGFANLPNQWHRKSVRKGFNFNVMVVGMWSR